MKRIVYFIYWFTALFVLVAGSLAYYDIFNVYSMPLAEMSHPHSQLELVMRSIYGAINLFLFNIDTDAVVGWMENGPQGGSEAPSIWLHALSIVASVWTIIFVAWIFASASWMNIKRYCCSLWPRKNLFVFWGINARSVRLAKELEGKGEYTLFVVEPAEGDDEPEGMDSIIQRGRRRVQLHRAIEGANASVFMAEKKLMDVSETTDAWREMDIRLVLRYLRKARNVHFLLLGDNEMENIYTAMRLSNRNLYGTLDAKVTVHCHARRNNASRTIEHQHNHYPVNVVDSSHIAIEMLKKTTVNGIPLYHPVQYVDLSTTNPGTVTSDFRALIVGFSESGQDALRFLYEFGAFMSSTNDDEQDVRSPFYCDVVDRHFGPSAQRWMNHANGMFNSLNADGSKRIVTHEKDYRSAAFYNEVLKPALDNRLNYVVISIGEDQAGIALAVDILRYASVHGRIDLNNPCGEQPTSQRFTVFVRAYEASMYDYLTQVAEQYKPFIVIFGAEKEIYTRRMLIDEELKRKAMLYYYNYEKTVAQHMHWDFDTQQTPEQKWEQRREKFSGSLEGRLNLRRQESQDFANALHEKTKFVLHTHGATPLRLAQTEHLRWVAAHEIMGYRYGEHKDYLRYLHNNIIPWSQLTQEARTYDYLTYQ